jgi:hypothetical protein
VLEPAGELVVGIDQELVSVAVAALALVQGEAERAGASERGLRAPGSPTTAAAGASAVVSRQRVIKAQTAVEGIRPPRTPHGRP